MNEDLLNILSNSNKEIDNQKLMDYLSDKLSADEKHEFEKTLVDSKLESDAVDGLANIKNTKKTLELADQLNRNLHIQLQKKKSAKEKRRLKDFPWLYFAIILLIIIVVMAFFVVWKLLR